MKYILKEDVAERLKNTYKSRFFQEVVGLSRTYTYLILNRRKACPKFVAYSITKAVNSEAEIVNYFDVAKED